MEIIVTKDSLKIAEKDLVHKGEYNVNELTFTFSEEYEGLSKMAVFSNTLNAVQTAITNNTCIIPAEILLKKMDLTIGVYAYTLENNVLVKRLSPAPITIKVENGSYIKGLRNPQIDNPTLFEQFMEQLEDNIDDLQEQINSKQDTLTAGDNITIENGVIRADVPTKTSDLINDSGFIDKAVNNLTNYTKTSELSSVALSGDYNDLDNKPTIPTKVSELQNDENYQTYDDVEAMISALGSVFTLKGTVNTIADLPQTGNQVGDVWYVKSESAGYVWINDDGTLRWEILGSTVDTSDFLTKSGLAQTTGQNTDNAMSQKAITDALNTKQATLNNSNKLNPDYVATNANKQFTSEAEKANWNNKSDFSGDYNDLTNKPDLTIYEEKTDAETKYETLLNQIPTATSTGNPINVQDSSNLPIVDFAMLGNATQQTYTGKNLWGGFTAYTDTSYQVTYTTNADGTITANGTSNNNNSVSVSVANALSNGLYKELPAGTYTISGGKSASKRLQVFDEDATNYGSDEGSGKTITLTSAKKIIVRVNLTSGTNCSNEVFNIQLENGNSKSSYEPYTGGTPAPNPDYPQDIHVVTGDNTVVVNGKNLFDKDNVVDGKRFGSDGQYYNDGDYCASEYIAVKPNTKYCFNSLENSECICTYDKDKQFISRILSGHATSKTTEANACYVRVAIMKINKDIWQIEENSTATTYEPYTEQTQLLSLGDIELAKIGTYTDRIFKDNGKWYLRKEIGKIASYNGETITTAYISTTGGLDIGATVYYVLTTPVVTEIE